MRRNPSARRGFSPRRSTLTGAAPALRRRLAFVLVVLLIAAWVLHSSAQGPAEPARSGAGDEESLSTFEPSEKVPADTAVPFPVDI
ncbi:MAG: hypothetical protein AAGM22_29090 [Acidobacteriota bacterium]